MNHNPSFFLSLLFLSHTVLAQGQTSNQPPSHTVKPEAPVFSKPLPIKPGQPVRPGEPGPVKPTDPATPPQQPKKSLDRNQLDLIVRRATIDFTREILDVVGDAYQVRYNLREGMLRAANQMGNYGVDYILEQTGEFQRALVEGRADGQLSGTDAGQSAAHSRSHAVANTEINAAIDHTLNTGTPIQLKQNPRMVPFSGLSSPLPMPRGIESRLGDSETQKMQQIERLLQNRVPSRYVRDLFDLSSIYRYHSTDLPSEFRLSRAFNTWYDNELNLHSSSSREARDFLHEITNVNLFEMATDNERIFRNVFESHMNLERPWSRRITSFHPAALSLGEAFYAQAATSYAHDRGYHKGHHEVFMDASKDSFNRSYLRLYSSNFAAIENQVRTSAVISEIQGSIVNEEGKSEVTYGDTFNVVLTRIANRGMVAADVEVEIPTRHQVTSFNNKPFVRVHGLTRSTETQTFQRLGWISSITAPDQNITVEARIHNQTISVQVKATYEELIRKALNSTSPDHAHHMMKMALEFMKKQYDDISGFRDQYRNRDSGMLLVRMRKLHDSLDNDEKDQLKLFGQAIRNVFGGKPNRFLNPKRDEWDASQAMINEMALPGEVPSEVNMGTSNPNN